MIDGVLQPFLIASDKETVNRSLQDVANASIRSLQTSIEIKLCQSPWNGL